MGGEWAVKEAPFGRARGFDMSEYTRGRVAESLRITLASAWANAMTAPAVNTTITVLYSMS